MRKLLLLSFALIFIASFAFAGEVKMEIVSFQSVSDTKLAEMCANVTGLEKLAVARIIPDHNTNTPGLYNAIVGLDGAFCTTFVTYAGTVKVGLYHVDGTRIDTQEVTAIMKK